ncbi:MAG: ABC-F family ATP-binding cassette domain-containing protein [Candidatus Sumerlaeaceae bacterium]|nr:ABC-F family ATP-binding cassette domain-containing protein [Candidatus Sumerlaeaceae bacterium]
MYILSATNLSKTHGLKLLFSGVSFGVEDRARTGLIGMNGCGKSTLLQVLAKAEPADSGAVTWRQDLRVEYLSQNPVFEPGHTVMECVFAASGKITALVLEYETACARLAHDPDNAALHKQFDEASRRMDAASAWEYESQARTILGKLGVTDLEALVEDLSGGYRKRVALARALLSAPDLLILDEPTNHLDADTVAWLEGWLGRFPGAVLLVTHDRYFLDRVTNLIVELDGGVLRQFEGNFSYYLARKAEMEQGARTAEVRRQSILRRELEWLSRGPRARTTKEKSRLNRIEELKSAEGYTARDSLAFQIEMRRLGGKIVELVKIGKSYGGRKLTKDFSYTFKAGDRLGVIGPNGSGKTTLANMIVGRLQPDVGRVEIGETVAFGYFDQECAELDPAERALDYVKREGGDMLRSTDGSARGAAQVMEQFLFTPQMLYTAIEKLSGGERRRLCLVRTLMRNPNFLVLDEPANDLDIPTLQALEDFLEGFMGCLLVISHDRYFLDRTVDHILSFEPDGTLRRYPGNYSDYELEKSREVAPEKGKTSPAAGSQRKAPVKSTKLSFNEVRELAALEKRIPEMEARLNQLETEMVEAATDYKKLQSLTEEQKALSTELEESMDRWALLAERA